MVRLHDGCMLIPQWVMMGMFYTRLLSGKSAGKPQHHSYIMHNPQRERCFGTALGRGERKAFCSWRVKEQFCEACLLFMRIVLSFLIKKIKGEGRRWKSGPEMGLFNTLVCFIEVGD